MTIQIREAQITAPSINSQRMLVFRVRVKPEDYTDAVRDAIFDASDNGTPLAAVFQAFQTEKTEDPLPKLRARLAYVVKLYSEKSGIPENELLAKLYARHSIVSRTELTEEKLKEEIDRYEA